MPPLSRRGAGFDRLSVLATYVGTAVFAIAAIAAVQHPPVYGALSGVIGRVENGLAAGVIAICIYLYGRRLGSREERFRLADMLCVEMTRMRDAMPDRAPDADLGRSRTRAEYIPARTAAPPRPPLRRYAATPPTPACRGKSSAHAASISPDAPSARSASPTALRARAASAAPSPAPAHAPAATPSDLAASLDSLRCSAFGPSYLGMGIVFHGCAAASLPVARAPPRRGAAPPR